MTGTAVADERRAGIGGTAQGRGIVNAGSPKGGCPISNTIRGNVEIRLTAELEE